jgi:hypothetical protein
MEALGWQPEVADAHRRLVQGADPSALPPPQGNHLHIQEAVRSRADFPLPVLGAKLDAMLAEVVSGRGFAVLRCATPGGPVLGMLCRPQRVSLSTRRRRNARRSAAGACRWSGTRACRPSSRTGASACTGVRARAARERTPPPAAGPQAAWPRLRASVSRAAAAAARADGAPRRRREEPERQGPHRRARQVRPSRPRPPAPARGIVQSAVEPGAARPRRNIGHSVTSSDTRIYATRLAQPMHTDNADLVGLLCLRAGRAGGLSSWASSVSVHNELLRRGRRVGLRARPTPGPCVALHALAAARP